jgi:resuscitation-promoting factor RpfA
MNRSPEPLSAEERALAERLARLDVRREPGPALDAAILAAARAAVTGAGTPTAMAAAAIATVPAATTAGSAQGNSNEGEDDGVPNTPPKVVPLRPRKPLSRLPLGLSLAASLVLAAGIGWRLADGGGSESALEGATAQKAAHEEQVAYSADAAAAADATEAVILEPEMNRVPPPPPPPPLDSINSQRREVAMAPPAPEREAKSTSSSSERDSEFLMDEGIAHHSNESADAATAGAFPAEPISQSAPALGNAVAAKPALAGGASDGFVGRARDKREASKDDRAESLDKVEVTGSRLARQTPVASPPPAVQAPAAPAASAASVADQPFDDQPPVSADSPEFRQAWLQRIRNLFAKGQADAGRTSLQEFRRRYPNSELPDDLKKIAATLPPPAP